MDARIESLKGGLVVSCQARGDNPLRDVQTIARMCRAVTQGGAVGVRVEGPEDVAAARAAVEVPVIGLWKVGAEGVYITPGVEHAMAIARAGADIVAVDGTTRPRPGGRQLGDLVTALRGDSDALVMADVASVTDADHAVDAGVDLLATTLSGYLQPAPPPSPDLELVGSLVDRHELPVVAEGRYHEPALVAEALSRGAHAVVVGTAITDLRWATRRFVAATETSDS